MSYQEATHSIIMWPIRSQDSTCTMYIQTANVKCFSHLHLILNCTTYMPWYTRYLSPFCLVNSGQRDDVIGTKFKLETGSTTHYTCKTFSVHLSYRFRFRAKGIRLYLTILRLFIQWDLSFYIGFWRNSDGICSRS